MYSTVFWTCKILLRMYIYISLAWQTRTACTAVNGCEATYMYSSADAECMTSLLDCFCLGPRFQPASATAFLLLPSTSVT